ncbi:carotenoid oxygenase [Rhizodiscina lignyota]|uniref:Carotenoid oxygenase n=1 Tax=Rhizodiscina lignyota TaxID=1504668 RepID=A0A9P4ILY5_9PEZI|nr:carotenoid oxygenase [Rhizodiscina lignyota]
MTLCGQKRKRGEKHPYLCGNFAPIQQTRPLTPCTYSGSIPEELARGQYVRNGGNPVSNEDLGRDAHWFDGDGMLSGVSFTKSTESDGIQPEFVNQYILTDVYLFTLGTQGIRTPILPSISTLVNPAASFLRITWHILRTVFLVILSCLAGSRHAIKKISVANTSILYHDGRALATCESGPPIRVQLPNLETVGWFNGNHAEGEETRERAKERFGGDGLIGFMKEWTTGHPKVDPVTKEMILYHATFVKPYVHCSVLPEIANPDSRDRRRAFTVQSKMLNAPVPGVSGAKMMHDFGASLSHTIIMDLPLSLDPLNLLKNRPVVCYNGKKPARFGVFPRRNPEAVRWFETKSCCIFHTANTWDDTNGDGKVSAVNMLACRLTTAALVFSAANIDVPRTISGRVAETPKPISFFGSYDHDEALVRDIIEPRRPYSASEAFEFATDLESHQEEKTPLLPQDGVHQAISASIINTKSLASDLETEQCRLYFYKFDLTSSENRILRQHALSILPFEFPSLHPSLSMQEARYIYGCSTSTLTSFGTALGKAAKIDVLLKVDALALIQRGEQHPPIEITGSVDTRTLPEVLSSVDPADPIKAFVMPGKWFAQEPRFVPRRNAAYEDDGFLLFYAFDEEQLDAEGEASPDSVSELWIVDAKTMGLPGVGMDAVVARVKLPQRVPYGLHGMWFSEEEIKGQRLVERLRNTKNVLEGKQEGGVGIAWQAWMATRGWLERILG